MKRFLLMWVILLLFSFAFASADGSPFNAWWLWTHLRWNTRVIILDNPAERAETWRTYGNSREDTPYTGAGTNSRD